MADSDWLTKQFEDNRDHLRNVAYRMLGSQAEAEDAVQETWIRLRGTDVAAVENLGGWLTTVTARVCLDLLRSRKRRDTSKDKLGELAEPQRADPGRDVLLADSIGAAMLVVLETLAPAERVAFVLHDMFELPFDEIAQIIDRTEAATRQLASRARRRVQGRDASIEVVRSARDVVDAFLAASRDGDFDALLAILDPEVVLRADPTAVRTATANKSQGAPPLVRDARGAPAIATMFKGRARGAARATIDGEAGAVWFHNGRTRAAFVFTVNAGKISAIDLIMEPDAIAELEVEVLS